jgi:hypothetical protein
MRHLQKPVASSDSGSTTIAALIDSLPPERRRQLLEAAAQSRMLEIIDAHQDKTIEAFFRAVQADTHWAILKDLPLSDVITLDKGSMAADKHDTVAALESAAADSRQMQLPSVSAGNSAASPASRSTNSKPSSAKPNAKEKAAAPRKGAPATQKSTGDIVEEVTAAIASEPGLRSEEIQRRLGKSSLLVKSTLAALRKNKRVRTEGANRATRYYPVPTR